MKPNRIARTACIARVAGPVVSLCLLLFAPAPLPSPKSGRPAAAQAAQPQGETGGPPAQPAAPAQPAPTGKGDKPEKENPVADHLVTTDGDVTVNGKPLHYKATAGTLVLKDEAGKPKADVFFVAYEKQENRGDPPTRPRGRRRREPDRKTDEGCAGRERLERRASTADKTGDGLRRIQPTAPSRSSSTAAPAPRRSGCTWAPPGRGG